MRAWARPFAAFERLTTAADRIEHFAILELILPLSDGAPPQPEASLRIDPSASPLAVPQAGIGSIDLATVPGADVTP